MRLLQTILGRVCVVDVRFEEGGGYTCAVSRHTPSGRLMPGGDLKGAVRSVVVVTVSGCGVVSKPSDAGIVAKVTADPATFIWSENDGIVSFLRRAQLQGLLEELASVGVHPLRIGCCERADVAVGAAFGLLRWRSLIRFGEAESAFAQAVAWRLMPLLLGLFLLLLTANALVGPRLQSERQELQRQLETLHRSDAKAAESSAGQERLVRDFSRRLGVGYAVLCDRIGACVPDRVTLSELWVEPLSKRFEADKPLMRRERSVVVVGSGDTSSVVGAFAESLGALPGVQSVRIVSVERTRDDGLKFKIEIGL